MGLQAQIRTALGDFVVLHREELVEQMMQPYDTLAELRTITTEALEGNEYGIPSTHLTEVIQGFQPQMTRKGNLTMFANTSIQRRHKLNVGIDPDTIVGEWESWMYDERVSRKDMPITTYVLRKLIMKMNEDRELQQVYKGVYAAPTPGTAGTALQAVDGYARIFANHITAGKITPFALGAYTPSTTFEYVENLFTSVPNLQRFMRLNMYMSPEVLLDYQRDKRDTFKYKLEMSELLKIDFSNIRMIGLPSMTGSKRIFVTVPGNLVRAINKNSGADNIEIKDYDPYLVDVIADWHESYGIADPRYIYMNDQA